jgi:Skp family chaperone for outer membrane proteins
MKARFPVAVIAIAALLAAPFSFAADKFGIFETIHASNVSFEETTAALDAAFASSALTLHATHDVRLPDESYKARVYVLTSSAYQDAAQDESPRTASAQVLRIAAYTTGDEQATFVNMANPVAHAMVYYSGSSNYDALVAAAEAAADEMRALLSAVPGEVVSEQLKPMRSEKHYNKYKGDGPARMMAKFRNYQKSQLEIATDTADNFDAVVERVKAAVAGSDVADAEETVGWEQVAIIPLGDDVVYIGVTNPFIEDRMVRINSRHRSDGKSDASPYPGVDHVTALPTDILVVREDGETKVLHYGQMWRMQLYFWDSGYRAFTANMGVPGKIVSSIQDTIGEE